MQTANTFKINLFLENPKLKRHKEKPNIKEKYFKK